MKPELGNKETEICLQQMFRKEKLFSIMEGDVAMNNETKLGKENGT